MITTGLVDFQIYCDMLATRIGCNPPLLELFFKKPSMWLKIMFGPFTMHQYRYQLEVSTTISPSIPLARHSAHDIRFTNIIFELIP